MKYLCSSRKLLAVGWLAFNSLRAFSQTNGDEILCTWWNQEYDAQIAIYKNNGKYCGKIVWLKEPNDPQTGRALLDKNNPDVQLRQRPVLTSDILYGFAFNKKSLDWSGGTIYDGRDGKKYHCNMTLQNDSMLKVRGFIGAAWMGLGKNNIWKRKNN